MYSKPSYQDNLFDGLEVDYPEFEISVKCPNKGSSLRKFNYATGRRTQSKKNFYVVRRPIRGFLELKLFCYFCESYYDLRIFSEEHLRKTLIPKYIPLIFTLPLLYWDLPFAILRYVVWGFIVSKIYIKSNKPFIRAFQLHKARMVRMWKPTQLTHQY